MSETNTVTGNPAENNVREEKRLPMSLETAKSTIQLELLGKYEKSIQLILNEESNLVYNEDNLPKILAFIDECKKYEKTVEDKRSFMKEPALLEGKNIDAAAKALTLEISQAKTRAAAQYNKICKDIKDKQEKDRKEEERKKNIKEGMSKNIESFSGKIIACKSNQELIDVERLLNLEKSRKEKYAEFLPDMIVLIDGLRPKITEQKEIVKQLEAINQQAEEAKSSGNTEALAEINAKKEVLEDKVQEKRVEVSEQSVRATNSLSSYSGFTQSFPSIKTKRKEWKAELILGGEMAALKAGLVRVELDPKKWREVLEKKKAAKELPEKEFIQDGVKYTFTEKFA